MSARGLRFVLRPPWCSRRWLWVQFVIGWRLQSGHCWRLRGLVRHDSYTLRGVGLVVMKLRDGVPSGAPAGPDE